MNPTTTNWPKAVLLPASVATSGYWVTHISGKKQSVQITSNKSSGQKDSENAIITCHTPKTKRLQRQNNSPCIFSKTH
jgi:hypothetical protein